MERERFSSRLGFLLISAGCAIGVGNVMRFPYITGQYGGAAFVLIYLFFLLILGLPIMVMEFSVGRASHKSVAKSFDELEPHGSKWHWYKFGAIAGNYLLMMFYTTVGGWMLIYFVKTLSGEFQGLDQQGIQEVFAGMLADPVLMIIAMVIVVVLCFGICSMGLKKGVEKITKIMMVSLLLLMIVLAVRSVTLPGSAEGLKFYLYPSLDRLKECGIGNSISAAMGQAFFTLSLGIGALAIFGSYIGRDRALTGEAINITILDTVVALLSGLIIFPACFAFGVNPDSGVNLIYVTLPNIFNAMGQGRIWGSLFFIFMFFASASTIIAVFENILSFAMDLTGCSRKKAVLVNLFVIVVLSLPCVFGFNLLSGFQPLGPGSNVFDLEDFIVSNNLLPLGSLVYLLFCVSRYGWGWDSFIKEANTGRGVKFPKWIRIYVTFILPVIVLVIFFQGYISKFF